MKDKFFNIHSGEIVKISTTPWILAQLLYATPTTAITNLGEYPLEICQLFLLHPSQATEQQIMECKTQFGASIPSFIDFMRSQGYALPFLNIDPFSEGWAINSL